MESEKQEWIRSLSNSISSMWQFKKFICLLCFNTKQLTKLLKTDFNLNATSFKGNYDGQLQSTKLNEEVGVPNPCVPTPYHF